MITNLIGCVLSVALLGADPQPPEDPAALAEFVMERNAESLSALGPVGYEFTEVLDAPDLHGIPFHDNARRGSYRGGSFGEYFELESLIRRSDLHGKDLGDFTQTERLVINPQYGATWTVEWPNPAAIFYRNGEGRFSQSAEDRLFVCRELRPHLYAFGTLSSPEGECLKDELLSEPKPRYAATARKLGDVGQPNLYELEWRFLDPNGKPGRTPEYRFLLDGDRGFLIVKAERFYAKELILQQWTIEPARNAPNEPWYPKTVRHEQWTTAKRSPTQVSDMKLLTKRAIQLENFTPNAKFNDADFQFTALGMPEGQTVCASEKKLPGERGLVTFYVSGTELVDADQARGTELADKAETVLTRSIGAYADRKPARAPASTQSNDR